MSYVDYGIVPLVTLNDLERGHSIGSLIKLYYNDQKSRR